MVKRNPHVAKLHAGYLFPEITRRKREFLQKNPSAAIISLGIGDTTHPLPAFIAARLAETAKALETEEGYSGYGPEEGQESLRLKISQKIYLNRFSQNEIFISDGSNSDIGRLQTLFGADATLAVQDPSYPVYVDTGVVIGQSIGYDAPSRKYHGITYMPCFPSNHFFPSLSLTPPADLIYFCSPNNPTGAVATHSQLKELVDYAQEHKSIIIFDTAYANYIQESHLPRSIYEIAGAEKCAIELGSFSKMAGFTGIRLAWSVVPKALQYESGDSVNQDWNRVHATFFNGASNIAQAGGLAVLEPEGEKGIRSLIRYYMENANILRQVFERYGYEIYGGVNAPYLWIKIPSLTSWEAFDHFLEKTHLLTAPGSGFGPNGEGFLRISAFGKRSQIEEASDRLSRFLR